MKLDCLRTLAGAAALLASLTSGCTVKTEAPAAGPSNTTAPSNAASADQAASSPGSIVANAGEPTTAIGKAANDALLEISFDDLICNIQPDIRFRPWMLTPRAKELDGRRIQVSGYMLPDLRQKGIVEFVFLRNTECKFGPGGQADHLIRVTMKSGRTADYKGNKPLDVIGRLKINPYEGPDGNTWCIYDLDCESVVWKRR